MELEQIQKQVNEIVWSAFTDPDEYKLLLAKAQELGITAQDLQQLAAGLEQNFEHQRAIAKLWASHLDINHS